MSPLAPIVVAVVIALAWFGGKRWILQRRRAIAARPLSGAWRAVLERNLPLYRRLPDELRAQLHGHIQLFLHDKRFYGFDGLEISDEMRLTVAGTACMLLLNRPHDHFSGFRSIYLYPSTFVGRQTRYDGLVHVEHDQARLGESWHRGPLVLAWDAVEHGVRDPRDGLNVVLHEFAHKLDGADGAIDGAPILPRHSHYASWARVMQREYDQLRRQAAQSARTVIDHYGASAPEEFFAVLVEAFYERPRLLQSRHPELYAEMQQCFRVDPLQWQAGDDRAI